MAASSGPDIVDSGLVLALDAADRNSYDKFENIITNSEFEYLQLSGSTVATANQPFVPYGRNTAVNFNNNGGAGDTYIYRNFNTSLASGTKYIISVFSNSPTLVLGQGGLASGKFTQISFGSITLSNGWYRHWVSYSATVNNPNIVPQVVVAQGINVTLSGWQVETGTEITDYYPTTGTTKTRGSTLIDLTGRGNTGTLTNGPTYSSSNNGSIVFDGTNDYVVSNLNLNLLPEVTFSGWIYTTRSSGNCGIMGNDNNTYGRVIRCSGSVFNILKTTDGAGNSTSNIPLNQWFNIVVTWSTSSVKFYLNSTQEQTTFAGESATYDDATSTYFGSTGPSGATQTLLGNIAQVSIYNRALTATEVQQNFNATRSRFGI
jgi:hypothetical protein